MAYGAALDIPPDPITSPVSRILEISFDYISKILET
jgi:hypothetical protein